MGDHSDASKNKFLKTLETCLLPTGNTSPIMLTEGKCSKFIAMNLDPIPNSPEAFLKEQVYVNFLIFDGIGGHSKVPFRKEGSKYITLDGAKPLYVSSRCVEGLPISSVDIYQFTEMPKPTDKGPRVEESKCTISPGDTCTFTFWKNESKPGSREYRAEMHPPEFQNVSSIPPYTFLILEIRSTKFIDPTVEGVKSTGYAIAINSIQNVNADIYMFADHLTRFFATSFQDASDRQVSFGDNNPSISKQVSRGSFAFYVSPENVQDNGYIVVSKDGDGLRMQNWNKLQIPDDLHINHQEALRCTNSTTIQEAARLLEIGFLSNSLAILVHYNRWAVSKEDEKMHYVGIPIVMPSNLLKVVLDSGDSLTTDDSGRFYRFSVKNYELLAENDERTPVEIKITCNPIPVNPGDKKCDDSLICSLCVSSLSVRPHNSYYFEIICGGISVFKGWLNPKARDLHNKNASGKERKRFSSELLGDFDPFSSLPGNLEKLDADSTKGVDGKKVKK